LARVHHQLQELSYTCQAYEVKEEGVSGTQAGRDVRDRVQGQFVELACYAPEEVVDDEKKQELFMEGLAEPLRYQLIPHTFPSFQMLLDKAIGLEYFLKELEDLKRKTTTLDCLEVTLAPALTHLKRLPFSLEAPLRTLGNCSFSVQCSRLHNPVLYRKVRRHPLSPQ
jgi:hypothetical protein